MKSRLGHLAPYIFVMLAAGAAIFAISKRRDELVLALGHLGPLSVGFSLLFGMLGTCVSYLLWRQILLGLGVEPPLSGSFRVFFVGQLGKYLPGSVWPVVAQMAYGKTKGIARRTILAANALTLALSLAVGLILGAVLLPFSSTSALRTFRWFFLFLPFLLALLHPRTIPGLLDWLFKRIGRPPLGERLAWSAMWRAAAWALLSWILLGLHLFALTGGLGVTGPRVLAATIGGFALAASAGVLFVPAPAGAGIRDVVLIATLGVSMTGAQALGIGLASRVLLIVVDLLMAALAVFGAGLLRRDRSSV
ncbi:MAG: lysylphosphatidylglycerol synthase domain-containing protein [Actinomycetota bacterium]